MERRKQMKANLYFDSRDLFEVGAVSGGEDLRLIGSDPDFGRWWLSLCVSPTFFSNASTRLRRISKALRNSRSSASTLSRRCRISLWRDSNGAVAFPVCSIGGMECLPCTGGTDCLREQAAVSTCPSVSRYNSASLSSTLVYCFPCCLQRSLKRFRVSGLKLAAKAPGRGIESKRYCCNYTRVVKRCKNYTASKVESP